MRYIGLVIAMILALGAAFLTFSMMGDDESVNNAIVTSQTSQPDYKVTDVVVASRKITIGQVISSDMLDSQPWPSHLVVKNFITNGEQSRNLVGMVARSNFQKSEPVTTSKLSNPDDPSFLAANLSDGMRVVTISTDGVAGLAGFLSPGDRVDIMVTHTIPKTDSLALGREEKQTVAETLLLDVKVVAIDRRSVGAQSADNKKIKLPSSVSLEVTLEQAQKVRLAQEVGYVSLVLRGISNDDVGNIDVDVTYEPDISKSDAYEKLAAARAAQENSGQKIMIVRGTESEEFEIPKEKYED